MHISVFDLFTIGIGPSSSHTVGPMRAAKLFTAKLSPLEEVSTITVELYGSLGATGKGHGSDKAVIMGLIGHSPEEIDTDSIPGILEDITRNQALQVNSTHTISFMPERDLKFNKKESLPFHPNGMHFYAYDADKNLIQDSIYYSIGGGFIVKDGEIIQGDASGKLPHPFTSGQELLDICARHKLTISQVMMRNEEAHLKKSQIKSRLVNIADVMAQCIDKGCQTEGILPGGMKVKRRAAELYRTLCSNPESTLSDPLNIIDWINLYALAVNEENAAGSRVVTAPTNGAAGIIPAVLQYCRRFCKASENDVVNFLLTAGAIGSLYKHNASISGADVGCQGEVGVACSMAAGALAEFLGGTPQQVENAAEIGMEHNLGLTCDPVGGLVQVPCIERNAMGAVKALNAARMALRGDGQHYVTLDKVIKTMRETGRDMQEKYKETARGGLAVNVIEC